MGGPISISENVVVWQQELTRGDVMAATRRHRTVLVAGIILASLLLFGCDFFDGLSESGGSRNVEKIGRRPRETFKRVKTKASSLRRLPLLIWRKVR